MIIHIFDLVLEVISEITHRYARVKNLPCERRLSKRKNVTNPGREHKVVHCGHCKRKEYLPLLTSEKSQHATVTINIRGAGCPVVQTWKRHTCGETEVKNQGMCSTAAHSLTMKADSSDLLETAKIKAIVRRTSYGS